jgi:hypothetical protein
MTTDVLAPTLLAAIIGLYAALDMRRGLTRGWFANRYQVWTRERQPRAFWAHVWIRIAGVAFTGLVVLFGAARIAAALSAPRII